MSRRDSAVAGGFYPRSSIEIEKMIKHYNKILDDNLKDRSVLDLKPRAIIVPHAGYIYSAFTANFAFRLFDNIDIDHVVVIGPSHRVYLKGSSISDYDSYETPLGDLTIDKNLINNLKNRFNIPFIPQAHQEHSTEVQMPFIKRYKPDVNVVEIVYGDEEVSRLSEVVDYLLNCSKTIVVISTDLSHYYDIEKANSIDSICLDGVARLDINRLNQGCEACGKKGVEAMLLSAKKEFLKPVILDYRTSADASGDRARVVGYMSAAFIGRVT